MSTYNYYLKVLKNNPTFDWKEQEASYLSASKYFLSLQDIDGDNVLHVFVRKHKDKTVDSLAFLKKLNERLWSDKNCNNLTPFEEAIEKDHSLHAKLLYNFLAEYGRLDSFLDLVHQMSDIRYLVNLSHVFHGFAKASKSDDGKQVEKRIKKYKAVKEKIIELNAIDNILKRSSATLRKNTKLLERVFQIFWDPAEHGIILSGMPNDNDNVEDEIKTFYLKLKL